MNSDHTDGDGPGHDEGPGHDGHGHAEEPLGPIDIQAWGAGALGVVIGLAVTACFVLATSVIGA